MASSSARRQNQRSLPRSSRFRPRQFLSKSASMRYRQGPVRSHCTAPRPIPKHVPMKKLVTLMTAALLLASPAYAIVGGGTPQADGVARAVVTIVGSRGNFCTGTLVAPKLVLTVAHCVQPGPDYKIVDRGTDGQPQLLNVRTVAIHPSFNMQPMQAHRPTADLALLQLEIPLKGKSTVPVGAPNIPIQVGSRFVIAGIGVTVRGDGKSGGATRVAGLVATGQPGTPPIRVGGPVNNRGSGRNGACPR